MSDYDEMKSFAHFWADQQLERLEKSLAESAEFTDAAFDKLPRDADGDIEDDYLRGAHDTLESYSKGLVKGFAASHRDGFDDTFDLMWLKWGRSRQHGS